ncbi:DegT/DnrJ/EryC1/StrS family aminotransferase [Halobacterium rubrum]|uniref:DegT/DnrJ/EryC1/StrS family aminotransferase n=1 Tax=Halobacterium TaxID=2239 RepID=UPI001F256DFC|nr:DegT/DnrJ/EryC1/StrS family aminotransferase [Halobacterium rubrum]MDH5021292.1 DegT/DnrJ/EryC1/StrS family aminotransferase [Halobacterium rubrum]
MIPIADPQLGAAERDAVCEVLEDGQLADGPVVREFESEFADHTGVEHAVATTNGTTALHATFEALGVGDGDRVVTTPFSFVASANAVRLAGGTPVFADVDPDTLTLDPDAVADAVARHDSVAAILAVHLYGTPAEMRDLRDVADDHGLALVEDAAQAHGATHRGEPVGSLADAACFSFYPTKNMTSGEGGMVTTDHDAVAERVRRFADHGRTEGYAHADLGHNFRMTSLCAAIGRAQLRRLPAFNTARREHADRLTERLADTHVETPTEPAAATSVYHQYTVQTDYRENLRSHLADEGVQTGVYYPTPIHEQPAYDDFEADCPVAERAADRVVSLPVHPGLDDADVEAVASAVESFDATVLPETAEAGEVSS